MALVKGRFNVFCAVYHEGRVYKGNIESQWRV